MMVVWMMVISGCAYKEKEVVNWYDYCMIAHAGGGIDGKTMTNSLEALELANDNGYKLIELDFQLTSDEVLVLKHDWDKTNAVILELPVGEETIFVPDSNTFKTWKVYRKYTTMTAQDLIDWMKKHPDIYIVTDSKDTDEETIRKEFSQIVQLCKNDEKLLSRFVVQIYNDDMYDVVKDIYDFPNMLYTIYQIAEPTEDFFYNLSDFCVSHDIKVVTIPKDYLWQPFIDILKESDLIVYTHTLNTITDLEHAINMKIDGVYTDFLYESDLELIEVIN